MIITSFLPWFTGIRFLSLIQLLVLKPSHLAILGIMFKLLGTKPSHLKSKAFNYFKFKPNFVIVSQIFLFLYVYSGFGDGCILVRSRARNAFWDVGARFEIFIELDNFHILKNSKRKSQLPWGKNPRIWPPFLGSIWPRGQTPGLVSCFASTWYPGLKPKLWIKKLQFSSKINYLIILKLLTFYFV